MEEKFKRFQILSFDGGGIKGIFSAAVLAALEEDLGIKIADHFDLITGTSTGGIIALGLGLDKSPKEIVDFYVTKGAQIFRNRFSWRNRLQCVYRKFPQEPLKNALRDENVFGEKLLGHSSKRLVITSYNLGQNDVYLFKTPHHERFRRDYKVSMWKIALATSAAPTYFPACRDVDKIRLIDGGVWANNPLMVGIIESLSVLGVPIENIRAFSLGTTNAIVNNNDSLDTDLPYAWRTQNDW